MFNLIGSLNKESLREFYILATYYSERTNFNNSSDNFFRDKKPAVKLEKGVYFFRTDINSLTWTHDYLTILIDSFYFVILLPADKNIDFSFSHIIKIEESAIFQSKLNFSFGDVYGMRNIIDKTGPKIKIETELFQIKDFIRRNEEMNNIGMKFFYKRFPQIKNNLKNKLLI